jgi:hypothetical protein
VARSQRARRTLLGFYRLPRSAAESVLLEINPISFDRAERIVWNQVKRTTFKCLRLSLEKM